MCVYELGRGADPDKPHQKKAKELRLERWRQKQADKMGDGGEKEPAQVLNNVHVLVLHLYYQNLFRQ